MAYNYELKAARVDGGGVDAYMSSAVVVPAHCACDYGNCADTVTAVVMVTSGNVVEVRASCEAHVDRMHQGWANKQVAVVRVNQHRA